MFYISVYSFRVRGVCAEEDILILKQDSNHRHYLTQLTS